MIRGRFLSAAAALPAVAAFAGGCATSVTPWQPPSFVFARAPSSVSIDDAPLSRLMRGTWHSSSSSCPPSDPTRGWPRMDATTGTLFVSDWGKPIEEYDASGTRQTPLGNLSYSHFNHPYGLSVGPHGNLYVANHDGNDVFEFRQGSKTPGLTLTYQVLQPLDAATDDQGNIYVVNDRGGPILIFPPGQSEPNILGGFAYPTQIAFDSKWNLYVVDHLYGKTAPLGAVFEFAPGSQSGKNLNLTRLNYPVGIAIDAHDDIAVSNLGNDTVTQYAQGSTVPKRTISGTLGEICDPVFLAFNASSVLYVVNNQGSPNGNVTGYKPTSHKPFVTLTTDMAGPRGIAVNPNWQP